MRKYHVMEASCIVCNKHFNQMPVTNFVLIFAHKMRIVANTPKVSSADTHINTRKSDIEQILVNSDC